MDVQSPEEQDIQHENKTAQEQGGCKGRGDPTPLAVETQTHPRPSCTHRPFTTHRREPHAHTTGPATPSTSSSPPPPSPPSQGGNRHHWHPPTSTSHQEQGQGSATGTRVCTPCIVALSAWRNSASSCPEYWAWLCSQWLPTHPRSPCPHRNPGRHHLSRDHLCSQNPLTARVRRTEGV